MADCESERKRRAFGSRVRGVLRPSLSCIVGNAYPHFVKFRSNSGEDDSKKSTDTIGVVAQTKYDWFHLV